MMRIVIAILILNFYSCRSIYFSRPKDDLIIAAMEGDVAMVKKLIAEGRDLYARNRTHNRSALEWAIFSGHLSVVKILVETGMNVNDQDPKYGGSAAREAMARLDKEILQVLIAKGMSFEILDKQGNTPLNFCMQVGLKSFAGQRIVDNFIPKKYDPDFIPFALKNGAKKTINVLNKKGESPLMWAAWQWPPEDIEALLKEGADPNIGGNQADDTEESEKVSPAIQWANAKLIYASYSSDDAFRQRAQTRHDKVVELLRRYGAR